MRSLEVQTLNCEVDSKISKMNTEKTMTYRLLNETSAPTIQANTAGLWRQYWTKNKRSRSSYTHYINRNARPNNNQLITYYLCMRYLLRIQQYPVNNTYNIMSTSYSTSGQVFKYGSTEKRRVRERESSYAVIFQIVLCKFSIQLNGNGLFLCW